MDHLSKLSSSVDSDPELRFSWYIAVYLKIKKESTSPLILNVNTQKFETV